MSGIKGSPTTQKLVKGFTAEEVGFEFVTAQGSIDSRKMLDTVARSSFRVGSQSVPRTIISVPDANQIEDTGTPAERGDFVRIESGVWKDAEIPILKVANDIIYLGLNLNPLPDVADEFYIMRYVTPRLDPSGTLIVTVTAQTYQAKALARLDASSANITDSAYVELITLAEDMLEVEIANTTGKALILAIGATGAEVDILYIPSSNLERQNIALGSGQRLSVKSTKGTSFMGEVLANFFA